MKLKAKKKNPLSNSLVFLHRKLLNFKHNDEMNYKCIVTSIKLSQIEKEIQWIDSTCAYIKRTLDDGTLSFLKTTIKLEIC